MLYLDTGCLVKLYYPEPESSAVANVVIGKTIIFTDLHELEVTTAMQLKVFRGEAGIRARWEDARLARGVTGVTAD